MILWLPLLLLGLLVPPAEAEIADLGQTSRAPTWDLDTITINNVAMFVTNFGSFAWDTFTGNPGLIFPWLEGAGYKTAVFASGLWMGAKVNGEIRVAISEYSDEYVPGVMQDSTFSPDDPRFIIYKIYRGDTTSSDYLNWPVEDGAPVDSNGNPLFLGDETLWAVYNDADPSAHTNGAGSTLPLGVEVQQTTFALDREEPLGNVIFLKFKIINKGPNTLDSTFVSLWSDPDLGGAMDDLVGCDTSLSVGFCYNATNNDTVYGSTPPCVGYDFLQGPIVPGDSTDTAWVSGVPKPGYKNLPMVSFNKYINGTDPVSASETYNYMQGLNKDGTVLIDPTTGNTTTFMLSGDPVAGTGWLDSNPADKRFMLNSGPFTMVPGDTQEVVAAIILGQGTDRLTSITVMKYNDEFAQSAFDSSNVWTDVEEETAREELTAQFCLSANYPNPFNPVTRIQYTVGGSQTHPLPVTLRVYNVLGQVVRTLVNERKERGTYEVIWDGKDESGDEVASGVYFYKLQAEGFSQTKKMVMMK